MSSLFESHLISWVESACNEWAYPNPSEEQFEDIYNRIPEGVRQLLSEGIEQDIIITRGHKFTLEGLPSNKGPYNWFSNYYSSKKLGLNWEYFVQVALYSQLFFAAKKKGLRLTFEDELMDLALYDNHELIVYIEVKENTNQLNKLIAGIRKYQDEVDINLPDRGNDALRKAKYLITRRPEYFCCYAIGARYDFRVKYNGNSFKLEKDIIPII